MESSNQASGNFDFQDFTGDSTLVEIDTSDNVQPSQTHTFKEFPDSALDEDIDGNVEENKLLGEERPSGGAIWTVEYYRKYFDVDTSDVWHRCVGSMLPKPGSNFLKDRLQHNPDLYGPFWICVTLIICVAVMGNLANYLQVAAQSQQYHWRYDFHKLTLAATVVFCYSWLVPLALWVVFWWRGHQANVTLLQLVCLYGYSLTVYIPISVLCATGVWQLQWALMLAGFGVSGAVLVVSLWSALGEERRQVALAVTTVVLLLHLALAAGFLLYFFRAPVAAGSDGPAAVTKLSPSSVTAAITKLSPAAASAPPAAAHSATGNGGAADAKSGAAAGNSGAAEAKSGAAAGNIGAAEAKSGAPTAGNGAAQVKDSAAAAAR